RRRYVVGRLPEAGLDFEYGLGLEQRPLSGIVVVGEHRRTLLPAAKTHDRLPNCFEVEIWYRLLDDTTQGLEGPNRRSAYLENSRLAGCVTFEVAAPGYALAL